VKEEMKPHHAIK